MTKYTQAHLKMANHKDSVEKNLNFFKLPNSYFKRFDNSLNPFEIITKNTYLKDKIECYVIATTLHFYLYGYYYFQEVEWKQKQPALVNNLNQKERNAIRPFGLYFQTIYNACKEIYTLEETVCKNISQSFSTPFQWFTICLIEQSAYDILETYTSGKNYTEIWRERVRILKKTDGENKNIDLKNEYNPYLHFGLCYPTQALNLFVNSGYCLSESITTPKFKSAYWNPFIKAQIKIAEQLNKNPSFISVRIHRDSMEVEEQGRNAKGKRTKYQNRRKIT